METRATRHHDLDLATPRCKSTLQLFFLCHSFRCTSPKPSLLSSTSTFPPALHHPAHILYHKMSAPNNNNNEG